MKRIQLLLILSFLSVFTFAQQYSGQLKPLLTDLAGWDAQDPEGMDSNFNNVLLISATREYTKGDTTLHASILIGQTAASYDIRKMNYETDRGFFRSQQIKNYTVYISYDKKENSGAIIVYLTSNPHSAVFILNYKATGWKDALTLAEKFDWDAMKKVVQQIK